MREPSQSRLRYFEAVCRHGTIRGAADQSVGRRHRAGHRFAGITASPCRSGNQPRSPVFSWPRSRGLRFRSVFHHARAAIGRHSPTKLRITIGRITRPSGIALFAVLLDLGRFSLGPHGCNDMHGGAEHRVEECFQRAKGEAGLADSQGRNCRRLAGSWR